MSGHMTSEQRSIKQKGLKTRVMKIASQMRRLVNEIKGANKARANANAESKTATETAQDAKSAKTAAQLNAQNDDVDDEEDSDDDLVINI